MIMKRALLILSTALLVVAVNPATSHDPDEETPKTKIVQACEDISKGSVITTKDLEYGEVANDTLTVGTLFNTTKAIDKVANKDIEKGKTLNKSDLVNAGSTVLIVNLKEKSLEKLKKLAGDDSIEETASRLLKDRLAKECLEEEKAEDSDGADKAKDDKATKEKSGKKKAAKKKGAKKKGKK